MFPDIFSFLPGRSEILPGWPEIICFFVFSAGFLITIKGLIFPVYLRVHEHIGNQRKRSAFPVRLLIFLTGRLTSVYPVSALKARLKDNPVFITTDNTRLPVAAGLLSFVDFLLAMGLLMLIYREETLWYVKLMMVAICFFIPWYTTFLILDICKYRIEAQIPHMIDEFRSSFVKHGKIRHALLESCGYMDKSLGRIIYKAADSVFLEKSLEVLKIRLNNIWFNIFVILLINYKQNGGELIDQLYRLNRTMSRYVSIEKKRSKRLIWYEVFALAAAAFSIPSIIWLSSTIICDINTPVSPDANFIMARLIAFSMLSLLIVRVMRRM